MLIYTLLEATNQRRNQQSHFMRWTQNQCNYLAQSLNQNKKWHWTYIESSFSAEAAVDDDSNNSLLLIDDPDTDDAYRQVSTDFLQRFPYSNNNNDDDY